MARPTGSKNKPKTATQLLDLVKTEYQKQGKHFKFSIEDIPPDGSDKEAQALIVQAVKDNPDVSIPSVFELEADADDIDTFTCGVCNAELSESVSPCPECGATLNW